MKERTNKRTRVQRKNENKINKPKKIKEHQNELNK